jgi:hypothetical protein
VTNAPWIDHTTGRWIDHTNDLLYEQSLMSEKRGMMRDLPTWRRCFPYALSANLSAIGAWNASFRCRPEDNGEHYTDADFQHLAGVQKLSLSYIQNDSLTDQAFRHLADVVNLKLYCCRLPNVTSAIFKYLPKLEFVDIRMSGQFESVDLSHLEARGCVVKRNEWQEDV